MRDHALCVSCSSGVNNAKGTPFASTRVAAGTEGPTTDLSPQTRVHVSGGIHMRIAFVLTLIALGCVLVGAVVLQSGMYNIAATEQHYAPTYLLLDTGMRRSVQSHARGI